MRIVGWWLVSTMDCLEIEGPKILENKTLEFKLTSCPKKYFLSNHFYVKYEGKIDGVDRSILLIPAISGVITVAWAIGADVYIDDLDASYLRSLSKIRSVMKRWYPKFSFSGKICVKNAISNRFFNSGYGLLFTGGIDSTASYIRHRNKKPILISIWQSPDMQKRLTDFSEREGVKISFIRTNIVEAIDNRRLHRDFGLHWWENVCHGIILTGLCAPLSYVEKFGTLFIASSHTSEFKYQCGSHPLLDNNISWADVGVVHDAYELSRQEKIRYVIKPYIVKSGYFVDVCQGSGRIDGSADWKSLRTMTGLVLEGIDPNKCGCNNVNEKTFDFIKQNIGDFIKRRIVLIQKPCDFIDKKNRLFLWGDIQKHIPETIDSNLHCSRKFFEWFRDLDIWRLHTQKISISEFCRLLFKYMLAAIGYRLPKNIQPVAWSVYQRVRREFCS